MGFTPYIEEVFMWQMERREILAKATEWLNSKGIGVNPMGVIIALDELGYLRDEAERLKWETMKHPPDEITGEPV